MLLGDKRIRELIKSGVLCGTNEDRIGPISCDLTTESFYVDGENRPEVFLMPGESAFVAAVESIHLPNDLAARVFIKNSRLRQGLMLDAPLYFPGHETTVFFRVTNVSTNGIHLDTAKGIAQIAFEEVDGVTQQYHGAFDGEKTFRGMGDYSKVYRPDMQKQE